VKSGGVTVSVVRMRGDKRSSSISFFDQSLMQSASVIDDDPKPDLKNDYSPSNTVISPSVGILHEPKSATTQDLPALPAGTLPTVPSATVPPHLPGTTKSISRAYSGFDAV